MHFRLLPLLAFGLLLAPAAAACSMTWRPFSEDMVRLGANRLAVRARAAISFERGNGALTGTATLTAIRCLRRPQHTPCPRSLSIRFLSYDDGINCPSPLENSIPGELRYFILERDPAGEWSIVRAERDRWAVRP
jgi:hypothetical protein